MSAEASQLKKKEKGKTIAFDPKLPKKLSVFTATSHPSWQEKYVEMVRASFDKVTLSINEKALGPQIPKDEMKKAMPFIQGLKKRLMAGESTDTVFDRALPFDEVSLLRQLRAGLKKTTGCVEVEIVAVEEGGKSGRVVGAEGANGARADELPPAAAAAVPGHPSFHFANLTSSGAEPEAGPAINGA